MKEIGDFAFDGCHKIYLCKTKDDENEMKEFGNASIARHKVPRYIEFVKSFPMNAAGKILKYKMREDAAKRLGLEG